MAFPDSSSVLDKFQSAKKGGFLEGWFWRMFPGTKTGTRVHSDVPPERKPERGYVRMFPRNEHRNEGTFAKTTLLQNHLFVSRNFWGPQAFSALQFSNGRSLEKTLCPPACGVILAALTPNQRNLASNQRNVA